MLNVRKNARRLWLGALASVLLLAGGSAQAQIADGLVAYWNFDNENYLDLIGGFDGTPEGSVPIPFVDGPFGKAIKLNGEDQEVLITGGEPDDLAFAGGSITVAAWFKVDAFDTGWQALIAKGEGTNWRVARRDPTDFMTASMGIAEAPQGGPNVNDGEWHHIAAIADHTDPGGMFIYIDGVLAESTAPALPVLAANGQRVRIGENPGALGREWEGEIDDVAIWSRPLSADEVTLLANAPLSSLLGGSDFVVIRGATANAVSFTVEAVDVGASVVNPATVTTLLDGVSVTPTVTKVGTTTTVTYNILASQNTFFASGSQHTLVVRMNDTQGNPWESTQNFTIAAYATIPPSYALAAPATVPGMVVSKVFQTSDPRFPSTAVNNTPTAEHQLAGGMVDQGGTLLANVAENAGPINIGGDSDGGLYWTANANWEQSGGDINPNPPQPDSFNSGEPAGSGGLYANEYPPGVLLGDDPNNYVVETIAYVQLTRGLHRWGVNSDEGFKVTAAPGQPSVMGITLGEFNGGRTAADTIFDFVVETDGYYPIRLLSWEGSGEASCEWFSVDVDSGERFLIGDLVNNPADAYAAFRTGAGRAHVRSILPAPGYAGAVTQPTIRIEIANGRTSYVAGSAKLSFDGAPVTPTVNGTVVTYPVPQELGRDTTHTVEFIWEENTTPVTSWTNNWSFTIARYTPADMPADSFWIEIEDFDHSGGQTVASASTMPYAGGAYNGLLATLNADYFDDQNDGDAAIDLVYRGNRKPNHANIVAHTGIENLGTARPNGFVATTNFRLGWAGNFWGNYTRTIPAGVYRAYAALSSDNAANILQAPLDKVTAGVGTTTQTLERVGTFYGNGATAWGSSILIPLRTSASLTAPLGAFKHTGGPVTLRFTAAGGDADWFVFVPATDVPPTMTPSLSSPSVVLTQMPYADLSVPADVVLSWRLEDQSTEVDPATIKLMFDGADVSTSLTISKQGTVTTVTYDPANLLELGQSYAYEFSFRAKVVPQLQTDSGTLVVNYIPNTPAGAFLIEAEDFNTAGGDALPVANTMPYLGNAYNGLSAVEGIDYQRSSVVADGDVYRLGEINNVPMGSNTDTNTYDLVRSINGSGTWQVTANYSCGWSGVGNWLNYTRNIPASTYQIWAGMSSDRGAQADGLVASLDKVVGSAAVSNQVVQAIGTFQSAGTRGWGNTSLVPLRDGGQQIVEVALGGVTTLRVNMNYGDVDYLMLIPTGASTGPRVDSIVINPDGSVTVTWAGSAVLEAAPTVAGPWTEVSGATSPYTFDPTESMLFGRLRQ